MTTPRAAIYDACTKQSAVSLAGVRREMRERRCAKPARIAAKKRAAIHGEIRSGRHSKTLKQFLRSGRFHMCHR